MSTKRLVLFGVLLVIVGYVIRLFFSAGHLLSLTCAADGGIVDEVEDSNLSPIQSPHQLKQLLSPAEYEQAMDTVQYYNHEQKRKWTWRARDYVVYNDELIKAKSFTAKLVLMYDNEMSHSPGGDREYFFQIRTYDHNKRLLDQSDFATWSNAQRKFCDGLLTNDYFLIRSCNGAEEIKRINQAGRFIRPSKRTILWLKWRGY